MPYSKPMKNVSIVEHNFIGREKRKDDLVILIHDRCSAKPDYTVGGYMDTI